MKFVLVVIYLIFMKLGGNSGSLVLNNGNINFTINWISGIGLICYLCSFILFTKIVIMFDLSYIMPIVTGIVQIATLVASKLVFKESISMNGLIGAIIIITGIVIMNWPKTTTN